MRYTAAILVALLLTGCELYVADPGYSHYTYDEVEYVYDEPVVYTEAAPYCYPGEWMCDDGSCIDIDYTCDGIIDCWHGEDEAGCVVEEVIVVDETPACYPGELMCDDGLCISELSLCDGYLDCYGGEDEAFCY